MSLFGSTDATQIYRQSFQSTWEEDTTADMVRFVVVDCETTGLNVKQDSIVTIGAISVQNGQILLDDQFEVMLKVAYNTAAVTVHGITRETAEQEGIEEAEALLALLAFLRDGVIVGHHIRFDIDMLSESCLRCFGFGMKNRWLDTMDLTLHLEDAGCLGQQGERKDFSLDGLCRRFSIIPHGRHTAGGDAFITAQIFLKLLKLANQAGRTTLKLLSEPYAYPESS